MRGSACLAICGALVGGCSFPDYVADLDGAIDAADSAIADGGGDTCTSPCGCAPADATSDVRNDGDAHGSDSAGDVSADATGDVTVDGFPVDAGSDATVDAPTDTAPGGDAAPDAIVAVDGAIGESCGPCSTGKKQCVGTTLACSVADDRKTVTDSSYTSAVVSRAFDRVYEIAIGYPLHKTASTPYSAQLTLGRQPYTCPTSTSPTNPDPACDKCTFDSTTGIYTCKVSKPTDGQLTIRLMHGQPTDPAPAELARVTVPSTSIALGSGVGASPTTFVFPIAPTAAPLPSGTSIYVEASTDSTAWSFSFAGDRPRITPAPPDVTMWTRTIYPSGPWVVETTGLITKAVLPAYAIDVRGCF